MTLVTLFFFSCFSTSVAWADDKRVIRVALVDVDGNTSADSTDIHYFVEKGIRTAETDAQLTALDDVLNAGAQANDLQNIAFGEEAYQAGLKAFGAGNCDEALDQLSQAVTYFEQSFAFLNDPDTYINALLHQAVCLGRSGSKPAGIEVAVKALVVQPKADTAQFTSEAKIFDAARQKLRDRRLSSIAVSTVPDGSRVFVNGRYRGVAPAFRPGLRRGVHFVHVERQGYAREGKRVEIEQGKTDRKVDITLKPARKKAYLESILPGLQSEIGLPEPGTSTKQLRAALLVDYVILFRATGEASKKQITLALYDLASERLLKTVSGVADWEARSKTSKNIVIGLGKDLVDVKFVQEVKFVPGDKKDPDGSTEGGIATKWWFWTIIGAVVLGGVATGLALGLQTDDPPAGVAEDGKGALIIRF